MSAPSSTAMAGKVVLITGATAGIGKAAALALAAQGATLVLTARDPARGQATVAEVKAASPNAPVELLLGDLSVQSDVRALAEAFKQRHARLDVLLNNAGAIFTRRAVTRDGHESTFAVNHLAYFLLTGLLLDRLKAAAPSRIINVSSRSHVRAKIEFDDLHLEHGYAAFRAYGQSKLANVLFTYELARKLAGTGVTVNVLHPGGVGTNFAQNNGGFFPWLMKLARPIILTPEQGADTSVYLASAPELATTSGQYFYKRRAVASSPRSHDQDVARRLWTVSEQLTGLSY